MKTQLLTTAVVLTLLAGCNTGSRSNKSKQYFGPGSTGANPATATGGGTGTTGGGATGGGGAGAGTVGQFAAGPALNAPRYRHTATVMNDGRVLVTGGTDGQGIMTESEVYDPQAGAWDMVANLAPTQNEAFMIDPTGQFATARQLHQAVSLADGRVLVCGGFGAERLDAQGQPVPEMLQTAYVFNPQTNAFAAIAPMSENRGWFTMTLTSNANVMAAGGLNQDLTASLTTADVYDPLQDTWTSVAANTEHTWGNAVLAGNTAMIVGGANVAMGQQGLALTGFPSPRVQSLDAQAGTFIAAPDNPDGERFNMGAEVDSIGNAFFAGGEGLDAAGAAVEIKDTTFFYDAGNQAWTSGPTLNTARTSPAVAEIGTTSDMLITGGIDATGVPTPECEVYGVLNNAMLGTVSMSTERAEHRAVTLQNNTVLVIGGQNANGDPLDSTEIHTR